MAACSCAKVSPSDSPIFKRKKPPIIWEIVHGRFIAVILAVLDSKRFFLLTLEATNEMQILQFCGAYNPLIMSFVNALAGLFAASLATYAIFRHKVRPCYSKVKILLQCTALMLVLSAVLNVVTLTSIGYHINVQPKTIAHIFNETMHLYITNHNYKYSIDSIQFELQCCGYHAYSDWFQFDWQKDPELNLSSVTMVPDHNVPFSCCKLQTNSSCYHMQIEQNKLNSINILGCANVLSSIITRIIITGCAITSFILFAQIYLIFLIKRVVMKPFPEECPSGCICLTDRYGRIGPLHSSSSSSYPNSSTTESNVSDGDTASESFGKYVCYRQTCACPSSEDYENECQDETSKTEIKSDDEKCIIIQGAESCLPPLRERSGTFVEGAQASN